MATSSLADVCAPINWVQLTSQEGIPVLVPAVSVQHADQHGVRQLVVTLPIPQTAPEQWVSVKEAVAALIQDIPRLSYEAAKKRIVRAIHATDLRAQRLNNRTYIETTSLGAWRLKQRDADLDRDD